MNSILYSYINKNEITREEIKKIVLKDLRKVEKTCHGEANFYIDGEWYCWIEDPDTLQNIIDKFYALVSSMEKK